MIDWYELFLIAVAFVWFTATERDRPAARVIFAVTVFSELAVSGVTQHIDSPWKLLFPFCLELATAECLLRWAPNRTGFFQVGCVVAAACLHLIDLIDCLCGTNVVYSQYGTYLGLIAAVQLLGFHDTFSRNVAGLASWVRSFGARSPGECNPALRSPRVPRV